MQFFVLRPALRRFETFSVMLWLVGGLTLVLPRTAAAALPKEVGIDGVPLAADIAGIGQYLVHLLTTDGRLTNLLTEEQLLRFKIAVRDTVVTFEGDLRDGAGRRSTSEVQSSPDDIPSETHLRVSRVRWASHWEDGWNMLHFTFHDYLKAAKIEDPNYQLSRQLPYRNESYLSQSDVFRLYAAMQKQTWGGSDQWLRELALAEVDRFGLVKGVLAHSFRVVILKNGHVVATWKDVCKLPHAVGHLSERAKGMLRQEVDKVPRGKLEETTAIPLEEQQSATYVYVIYPSAGEPFPILRLDKDAAHGLKGYAGSALAPVLDRFLNMALLQAQQGEFGAAG